MLAESLSLFVQSMKLALCSYAALLWVSELADTSSGLMSLPEIYAMLVGTFIAQSRLITYIYE